RRRPRGAPEPHRRPRGQSAVRGAGPLADRAGRLWGYRRPPVPGLARWRLGAAAGRGAAPGIRIRRPGPATGRVAGLGRAGPALASRRRGAGLALRRLPARRLGGPWGRPALALW